MSILNQEMPIACFDADTTIPTKVVLHFRRIKWDMVPEGIDTCSKFSVDKIVDKRIRNGITEFLVRWGAAIQNPTVGYL